MTHWINWKATLSGVDRFTISKSDDTVIGTIKRWGKIWHVKMVIPIEYDASSCAECVAFVRGVEAIAYLVGRELRL